MALDFLILYEHAVREYESILLLKAELARRGYTAEIHQLLDRKKIKYFTWKKPRVLVSSCMYDDEAINSHVFNNVGVCRRVVNLHWEQMLSDTQEAAPWFNFNGNAKKCVQTCWGEKTRARLIAHGVPEQNCPVTGAVMMDFLRPQFKGYFKDKETLCREYGLDPAKKLFLYISSFGYASMSEAEVREISDMSGEDFTAFARTNRVSMAETLRWFDRYLEAHPEVEFVYRRHPSEWQSKALEDLAAKRKNFHVIFAESVKQWITAADKIFIWMSTAIAEVYCAGKSCHILRPAPIEHEYDPVIYKDAAYIAEYDDFAKAADSEGEDAPFPIGRDVIEGYFDASETPAYIRMADLLEDVYKSEPRDDPFAPPFKPHFNLLKFCALIGVHMMYAVRFDPKKLARLAPGFAATASRIYGYIDKAHVSKAEARAMEEKILRLPVFAKQGEDGESMNTPTLTTERLILRRFAPDDMEAIFKIYGDREANTFLPWFPLADVGEARVWYEERIAPAYSEAGAYYYAVCLKTDGEPIGYVQVSAKDSRDLGYGLRHEFWHQGMITEACRAVIEQLARDGVPYITATHDVNNPRSGAVMQRLGMRYQYSYEEQWQPKDILVTFRLYHLFYFVEKGAFGR